MVNAEELTEILRRHHEWLLVREFGKSFSLTRDEIEIDVDRERALVSFLYDSGYHTWRLNGFTADGEEVAIDVAGSFARKREVMRLIPRASAAELTNEVRVARLKAANEIAQLIPQSDPQIRLGRVALNEPGGRLAEMAFDIPGQTPVAAIADVTNSMSAESILAAGMMYLERLGSKKRPVFDLWILAETRRAKNLQKLHALLRDKWKAKITIVAVDRKSEPACLVHLQKRRISELWREKAPKLTLPKDSAISMIAERIIGLSPDAIDIVNSRKGETLRFRGLSFARVRTVMGIEKAWFGIGTRLQPLTTERWADLVDLVGSLESNRQSEPPNRRHGAYRSASEAWLESILRRDIRLLDANLVLSPIYNQFRASTAKIDLLALRRDGRLVIIELKTQPDREMVLQAADYWRKIELQRRRGILASADLFEGREIADRSAIVYLAAPAWSFHRDQDFFAEALALEIEMWRFDLHEGWREKIRVVTRQSFSDAGLRRS